MKSEIGLDGAGTVLRHAIELAGISLLCVRQYQRASFPELAIFEDQDLLVTAKRRMIGQQSPVPVPFHLCRRYRANSAHNAGILADRRLGVAARYQQDRPASEIVDTQIGKCSVHQLSRAATKGRLKGGQIVLDQPHFHLA